MFSVLQLCMSLDHVKEFVATNKISERQLLEFRMDCRAMLVTGIKKIIEKSPVNYSLVRNVTCLAPGKDGFSAG